MKKIKIGLLVVGVFIGLIGCSSNEDREEESKAASSVEQTIEDTSAKEDEKMEQMKADLEEKGVEVDYYDNFMHLTREKGIDYDYFDMTIVFAVEIYQIRLTLKGNIDGKEKEDLIYTVNKGRIVESSGDNTDIDTLAEVLKSLDYSDKDMVDFAEWYYQKNK